MSNRASSASSGAVVAAAANNSNGFEDLLHCMICFESYCNPKMLNCAHTFCEECLHGYLATYQQQRRAQPGKLPCPTCRELTTLPSGGVNALRNDFKVQKIEEMFRTIHVRQRAVSRTCDACRAQKKSTTARVHCTQCALSYCDACAKRHDKNPLFKGHRLVDKNAVNAGASGSAELACKVHAGEAARYFCRTCETVVCTVCVVNAHADHETTDAHAAHAEQRADVQNLRGVIEAKVARLRARRDDLKRVRSLNLNACQRAELAIKDRALETLEAVRRREKELLQELHKTRDEHLARIASEMESIEFHIAKSSSLRDFADVTAQRNDLRLMAVHDELVKRMRTVLDSPDASSASHNDADDGDDIMSVVTFLVGHHEPSLGRVQRARGDLDELARSEVAASPRRASSNSFVASPSRHPTPTTAKVLINIDKVGSQRGQLRDPLGVACLLSGDIVVAEWGNKRLQVFDSVGKPLALIGANNNIGPQGVAISLKGNIIVTDAANKRLQVFSPSGAPIAKWGLGKFYGPCGVAMSPNGNCVVTDVAEHSLNIYQGERRCLKRIGSRGSADDQFDNPLYVAVGQHNQVIVSDSDNHCIKIFSSSGRFVTRFGSEGGGDGQMRFPRGVCTDHDDNIVVADRNNHRVCLFSQHGRFLRHLLTRADGVRDPYGVAFSGARNLALTESGANRASLKLFQL